MSASVTAARRDAGDEADHEDEDDEDERARPGLGVPVLVGTDGVREDLEREGGEV